MSFGKNLQHLRRLSGGMTQEALAEKMEVSRQTVSKWELDQALPEMDKAIALCRLFSCTLDSLFREDLDAYDRAYSNLRVEVVPPLRYIRYPVISPQPERDALERMAALAREHGVDRPRLVGWDFPVVSPEQTNVYHLHGYTAAWLLPEGVAPEGWEILSQGEHKYAAITIASPFENPFTTIPNAYRTLMDYMRLNGYAHSEDEVIPCFETAGESMGIYIACK